MTLHNLQGGSRLLGLREGLPGGLRQERERANRSARIHTLRPHAACSLSHPVFNTQYQLTRPAAPCSALVLSLPAPLSLSTQAGQGGRASVSPFSESWSGSRLAAFPYLSLSTLAQTTHLTPTPHLGPSCPLLFTFPYSTFFIHPALVLGFFFSTHTHTNKFMLTVLSILFYYLKLLVPRK